MAEISSCTDHVSAATQLPNITIGVSAFPEIRQKGTLFVDKTAKLPWLLEYYGVFFARPRRFGKTTLAYMLFELFMHGKEQFKGLAVYDTWPEKQCYPTIMISLYGLDKPETFEASFCKRFIDALGAAGLPELKERAQGITDIDDLFSKVRDELLSLATVWLIDEVDYPLSVNLDNHQAFDANASVLKKFFAQLRMLSTVHFILVTGIMRYQNTSVFSGQDIVNISMEPDFADLLGYTQAEVEANFAPYIARAAGMLGLSREAFLERLKLQYDGFCFDYEASVSLYCPWSINSFFQQCARSPNKKLNFRSFWMNSANASTALRSFLQARRVDLKFLDQALNSELKVAATDFNDPSAFEQLNLPSIMVQSGYLSIKRIAEADAASSRAKYYCGFPNLEVESEFATVALAVSMADLLGQRAFEQIMAELRGSVRALDMAAVARALNSMLVGVYYDSWANFDESHYRTFIELSLIASCSSFIVRAETYNSHGRSDIELEYDGKLLVIELKRLYDAKAGTNQTACLAVAQEAQDQVLGRKYSQNFDAMQRPPYKERNAVVVVISDKARQIVYWRLLSLDKAKLKQEPLLGEDWVVPLPLAESKDASADEAGKKPKKKKSAKRGAAKQDVARDEGQPSISGEVTPLEGGEGEDAGASTVSAGESSAAASETGSASSVAAGNLPQGKHPATGGNARAELKLINPTSIKTILAASRPRPDSKDKDIVTLNEDTVINSFMAIVADLLKPEVNYSKAEVTSLVQLATNLAQTIKTPKLITVDRAFLVQALLDLLGSSS